jgi:hypothetical protein
VIAAGIFTGIAGLGIGHAAGLLWEQVHRHRRRERLAEQVSKPPESIDTAVSSPVPAVARSLTAAEPPRLALVPANTHELPDLTGKSLVSVRFGARSIEMLFGRVSVEVGGNPTVVCGPRRFRFPDPGARDALCALIGASVQRVRASGADSIAVGFDSGCDLVIERSSVAVA